MGQPQWLDQRSNAVIGPLQATCPTLAYTSVHGLTLFPKRERKWMPTGPQLHTAFVTFLTAVAEYFTGATQGNEHLLLVGKARRYAGSVCGGSVSLWHITGSWYRWKKARDAALKRAFLPYRRRTEVQAENSVAITGPALVDW